MKARADTVTRKENWFRLPVKERRAINSDATVYMWASLLAEGSVKGTVYCDIRDAQGKTLVTPWKWQTYDTAEGALRAVRRWIAPPRPNDMTNRQAVGFVNSTPARNYCYAIIKDHRA